MKYLYFPARFILVLANLLLLNCDSEKQDTFNNLKGPYLGQKPPGTEAVMFAPGIISTGLHDDAGPAFNYEGTEIFYRIAGKPYGIIATMKEINGKWSKPDLAPFSGRYPDGGADFSFDFTKIYFGSRRPAGGRSEPEKTSNIWVAEKLNNGFGESRKLGPVINTIDQDEYLGSIASNGNMYFNRRKVSGRDMKFMTFCSKYINDVYTEPDQIHFNVPSGHMIMGCAVSPDEEYLVTSITGQKEGYGAEDLYVCFETDNGGWSDPVNLGAGINSSSSDWMPRITRDGKYLFFVSWRYDGESYSETDMTYEEIISKKRGPVYGWGADIYWVSTDAVLKVKPDNPE